MEVIEEDICEKAISLRESVSGYTEQAFKMYGGESVEVVLEFDDSLIGAIHDKFGEETKMTRTSEHSVTCKVRVQISPTFWGWLFQFDKQMELVSPSRLRKTYFDMHTAKPSAQ